MLTFIHPAATIIAARAKFFDFDQTGRPEADCASSFQLVLNKNLTYFVESCKACEKFYMVFNVSVNVFYLSPDLIRGMKNVSVLYFGRWQSNANIYKQVRDDDFLNALRDMKHLRLLSF